jgi:hypothetical protein
MVVFLVPAGLERFEIYSETSDDTHTEAADGDGWLKRLLHRTSVQWQRIVDAARRGSSGRIARWRDRLVCNLAETIAEQRTLWNLRHYPAAVVRYPASLQAPRAPVILAANLAAAQRHHLIWFLVDLVLLIVSGAIAIIPGPNVLAYYLLFRVIGHILSWQGARRAATHVSWTYEPDENLRELAQLVNMPRDKRAPRVREIAERLKLARLAAFFDRVAVPST